MMTVLFKLTSTFASTFEKQKESSFEQVIEKEEEDEKNLHLNKKKRKMKPVKQSWKQNFETIDAILHFDEAAML